MKINTILICSSIALLFTFCTSNNETTTQKVDLDPILDQYTSELYALNPLLATSNGVNDYNDRIALNLSQD